MSDSSERRIAKTVLIVILIASATLFGVERTIAHFKARKAETDDREETARFLKHVERMLYMYRLEYGNWPRPSSDLKWLYTSRHNPHVSKDAWGQPFAYRYPAPMGPANSRLGCDLYSLGANGIDEGGRGDDIVVSPYMVTP